MGVTISSKRYSCDMGYAGFGRFRNAVAEKVGSRFYKHYLSLTDPSVMVLSGKEREDCFAQYDAKTHEFIENGTVTAEVANFLYQSDCEGKIDRKQAKQIYELIKGYDDGLIYGYAGRPDCATMASLKHIFSDGTQVKWM